MNTNNSLQVFEHEILGSIRVISKEGEPWFVGKDLALVLGYNNPSEALKYHVEPEDKLNSKTLLSFNNETLPSLGQRGGWFINESGMYSLIMSSKLPAAKAFKRWVTSEVLPTIRRHGMYMTTQAATEALENPSAFLERAFELAQETLRKSEETIRIQSETITRQQHIISQLQPKAAKYDKSMTPIENTLSVAEVAAMLNKRSTDVYKVLCNAGYLYKDNMKAYRITKEAPKDILKEVKTHFSKNSTQIRITGEGVRILEKLVRN